MVAILLRERLCIFDHVALKGLNTQGGCERIQICAFVPFYHCTARPIYSQHINTFPALVFTELLLAAEMIITTNSIHQKSRC